MNNNWKVLLIISFIASLAALYLGGIASATGAISPLALANQGIRCTSGSPATGDCVTVWNGGTVSVYSDAGSTRKFYINASGVASFGANPLLSTESITPTNNGTITPTQSIVTLTPAGAVTITLGTCTTGAQTWLYNTVNASVIITDSGASGANLAGNQTLTQYDVLPLVCISGNWVQTSATSAN